MSLPVKLYRLSAWCYGNSLGFVGKLVTGLNRVVFSCWLPGTAKIGDRLTVGYQGLGIVVHSDSVIGDDCWISQHVTIGRNFGDLSVPTIGNRVYIGAGTVIFGEISVGDGAIIGSNSIVNRDVPAGSVVAGNPARVVRDTTPDHLTLRAEDKARGAVS